MKKDININDKGKKGNLYTNTLGERERKCDVE